MNRVPARIAAESGQKSGKFNIYLSQLQHKHGNFGTEIVEFFTKIS
jgi:hypothetical protein